MAVYLKQKYKRPPVNSIKPNLGHPTLKNCFFYAPLLDLRTDAFYFASETLDWANSTAFMSVDGPGNEFSPEFDGTSNSQVALSSTNSFVVPYTGIAVVTPRAYQSMLLGSTSRYVAADWSTTIIYVRTAGGFNTLTKSTNLGLNRKLFYALVVDGVNNCVLYYGLADGQGTLQKLTGSSSIGGSFTFGYLSGENDGTNVLDGHHHEARWYSEALDDRRIDAIWRNRFAPFERRIWVPVGVAGTQYNQSVAGSSTATGALTAQALKLLTGSTTSTGALTKQTSVTYTGSITSTGSLIKETILDFAGSITATGTVLGEKISDFFQSVAGSITPSGSLVAQGQKLLTGSITATGDLVAKALKLLTGSITSSGALSAIAVKLKSVAGSITASGALDPIIGKNLSGSITATGSLLKQAGITLTGSITTTGSIIKQAIKALTGSITSSGDVQGVRTVLLTLTGSITASGVQTNGGAFPTPEEDGSRGSGSAGQRMRRGRGR